MAVVAQAAHLTHAKAGQHAQRTLGQLVAHRAPIDQRLHRAKRPLGPVRVGPLAVGEHVKALGEHFLEELRAPTLAVEGERHAPLAHQRAYLRQDLLTQHRQKLVVGRSAHHKQRLGVLLIHPDVGGRRHAQAPPCHPRLGQLVGASMIGPYMPIDIEQSHLLGVLAHPALRERAAEPGGLLARSQLPELAPQGLDLGGTVQSQQHPEFPRRVALQLLGGAQPQQRHEGEDQQRGTQAVEAILERTVGLAARLQQSERQHRRQCQHRPPVAHRLSGHELRGGFLELPHARQRPFAVPLHRHAPGGARRPLAALARPGPRDRLAPLQLTGAHREAHRRFVHPDALCRLPHRQALREQLLRLRTLLSVKPMRTPRPALALHHPQYALGLDLAALAVQRGAIDLERGAELVLAREPQLHHLHGGQTLPGRVVLGVHEHRHAGGEVSHLIAFAHDRQDRVDRFRPSRLDRQAHLRGHR